MLCVCIIFETRPESTDEHFANDWAGFLSFLGPPLRGLDNISTLTQGFAPLVPHFAAPLGCNRAVPSGLDRRIYCESHTRVPLAIQVLQPNQIFYGALASYLL
jgi:hypothetical protein